MHPSNNLPAICLDEGFQLLPNHVRANIIAEPFGVHFRSTAQHILKEFGEPRLRLVLRIMKANAGRAQAFKGDVLRALADAIHMREEWVNHPCFLQVAQTIDLHAIRERCAARAWPITGSLRVEILNYLEAGYNEAS